MALPGPVRRRGRRSGSGSRRTGSWPARAVPGSRRTTAPGPPPGTAGGAGPARGPVGWLASAGNPRSRGARFGGGTSGVRSSGALPLLVLVVCDGRREPADRGSVPGCRNKEEGRGSRDTGSAASWRTGERLALRSPRGVDPEGGAVVLEGLLGHDVVADDLTEDGAQPDGATGDGHTGTAELSSDRERSARADCGAGVHDRSGAHADVGVPRAVEIGGGHGPRGADHRYPLLSRARARPDGQERGSCGSCVRDTMAHAETRSIELTGTSSGRVVPDRPARPPSPSVSTRPGSGCTAGGRSAADGCQHVLAVELQFAGPDARQPGELP